MLGVISDSNFATRTQTKNESAAEVAELVIAEVDKLSEGEIPSDRTRSEKIGFDRKFRQKSRNDRRTCADQLPIFTVSEFRHPN